MIIVDVGNLNYYQCWISQNQLYSFEHIHYNKNCDLCTMHVVCLFKPYVFLMQTESFTMDLEHVKLYNVIFFL